jgi:hypothetical protein
MLFLLDKIPELRSLMPVELWLIVADFQKANFQKRLKQTPVLSKFQLRTDHGLFTRGKPRYCWEEPGELVFDHLQVSSSHIRDSMRYYGGATSFSASVNRIRWVLCYEGNQFRTMEISFTWRGVRQNVVWVECWDKHEYRQTYNGGPIM